MALEYTNIPDKRGAGLYLLHDGTLTQGRRLERLAQEVQAKAPKLQIVQLSIHDPDGEHVRDFYDIQHAQLPAALIVRDNDELPGLYTGASIPPAPQLTHLVQAVG